MTSIHSFSFAAWLLATSVAGQEKLQVCATTSDLGSIASWIGGEHVDVTVFSSASEDPHFVIMRPSFVRALHEADLYLETGLDLELGWARALVRKARNTGIRPGGAGYFDASRGIPVLGVPSGTIDRSMGHLHAQGNPHFLLDPIHGIAVAKAIRDRLTAARPDVRKDFEARFSELRARIGKALVGNELFDRYPFEKLAVLFASGRLASFLEQQGEAELLGGWFAKLLPYRGTKVVGEHDVFLYFARRFGLEIAGFLEPRPGVPPTTKHLGGLIRKMESEKIRVLLTVPYFNSRHARFVAERTGVRLVPIAHQVGARPGTDSYPAMIDYNLQQIVVALQRKPER